MMWHICCCCVRFNTRVTRLLSQQSTFQKGLKVSRICNRRAPIDSGFVLLVVLWWLTLIMFVVAQISSSGHMEALIATNIRGSAIAEAEADGAVNDAIFQYLTHRWPADGAAHLHRGANAIAEVRIDDEGAKIDPNVAPAILIAALLQICGAAPQPAERLALAISEWRSVDLLRPFGGEQAPQYRAAGLTYLPPNKRFVSKEELGLVIGMTPELLACISPHISIYSLSVPTLQQTADQVVRKAIMQAYPEDPVGPAGYLREAVVIRITAAAHATAGSRFFRVAVVRIAGPDDIGRSPYNIVSWEQTAE